MSGTHAAHSAPPTKKSSGSGWKIGILVAVLVLVLAALGFLLWQMFGASGGSGTADIAPGIFTQVSAGYSDNGKNVSGNIAVTEGTQRPEDVPAEEDMVLLDISWTGKKALDEPLLITVSDPSFTNGDGLAVHH